MVTVTEQDFTNLNEIEKIQVIKDILQGKVILKEGKTNEWDNKSNKKRKFYKSKCNREKHKY